MDFTTRAPSLKSQFINLMRRNCQLSSKDKKNAAQQGRHYKKLLSFKRLIRRLPLQQLQLLGHCPDHELPRYGQPARSQP